MYELLKDVKEAQVELPEQMNNKIVGILFNEDNKIISYIYEKDKVNLNELERHIFADDELINHIIEENRKYEVQYIGKYGEVLNINDKNLFIEAQAVYVEREEDIKMRQLENKVSQLETLLTQLTATLNLK